MLPVPIQTLLLIAAGFALFRLWRAATPPERWLKLVVAAGFLARAVAGQILFWISWAHLPIARGLQLGNGLWFFAVDGAAYFEVASASAEKGPWAIVMFDRLQPSVIYLQTLASSISLFGRATSNGLLLNLFCYLATIAIIVRWAAKEPRARTAAALAIVALSFSPSLVLWSLQPLKDSFFQLLFVAFVASCAAWQRAWRAPGRWRTRIATSVLLPVLLYAVSAVRWYFGLVLLITAAVFLLVTAIKTAERKLPAFSVAAVVIIILAQSLVAGSGTYLPPQIRAAFMPATAFAAGVRLPGSLVASVETVRVGFEGTGGGTFIQAGNRLASIESMMPKWARVTEKQEPVPPPAGLPNKVIAESKPPAAVAPLPPVKVARPRRTLAAPPAGPAAVEPVLSMEVPAWATSLAAMRAPAPPKVPDAVPPAPLISFAGSQADEAPLPAATPVVMQPVEIPQVTMPAKTSQPVARVSIKKSVPAPVKREPETVAPAPIAIAAPAPAPASATATPVVPELPKRIETRSSPIVRLLSGAGAIVVPRAIGERLGIFHVGGGRGMFWFTDLDTLVFDLVLLCVVIAAFSRFRAMTRNPLAWLAFAITLLVGAPLIYTVTNFGTLFRLREMIYVGLLLMPLAAASSAGDRNPEELSPSVRRRVESSAASPLE
jgi:hypothetical protein